MSLMHADLGELTEVTDLDLIAVHFDGACRTVTAIGESKSGSGKSAPAALDRVVWLRGLMELVKAERSELTLATSPSGRSRKVAAGLGVHIQGVSELAKREKAAGVERLQGRGPHSEANALLAKRARQVASNDVELLRLSKLLTSDEAWLGDAWLCIKRQLTILRRLSARYAPQIADDEQFCIRWLLAEALVAFTYNTVRLAWVALRYEGAALVEEVSDRLSEGVVPLHEMRHMSDAIDRYITDMLARAGAQRGSIVQSLGAFSPTPPTWSEPYAELLRRLATGIPHARDLPRYTDLIASERLLNGRPETDEMLNVLKFHDPDAVRYANRLALTFLRGQGAIPEQVATDLA
ncbi:hypothetical protein ACWEOW_23340 [Monashia sp. NPDC004114]